MGNHQVIMAELNARIEQMRRDRIAAGNPANPPEPFLPYAAAIVLAEDIPDYLPYIVKYTQILNETDEVHPIDTSKLDRYFDGLKLIGQTAGTGGREAKLWAIFTGRALALIIRLNNDTYDGTVEKAVRQLHQFIRLIKMGKKPSIEHGVNHSTEIDDLKAECERYRSDESLMDKWRERYAEIEGDL